MATDVTGSQLLEGLWTQRAALSMPRSRGTFRKTSSRKWVLPSRKRALPSGGLCGTRGQCTAGHGDSAPHP